MKITRTDICLFSDFKDDTVTFGVYLSPESDSNDDELNEAIQKWAEGDDVELFFSFSVRGCVQDMIDFRMLAGSSLEEAVMLEKDKPMVDAMRAELLEMVALLDKVRFTS